MTMYKMLKEVGYGTNNYFIATGDLGLFLFEVSLQQVILNKFNRSGLARREEIEIPFEIDDDLTMIHGNNLVVRGSHGELAIIHILSSELDEIPF